MEKKLLIILLLSVSLSLSSLGTLTVESIKELPAVHTNLKILDADGKFAPVLVIKTELEGLGFENIGRPTLHSATYDTKEHQYKFYLNTNQRVIKITHPQYEALEVLLLSDFNIDIKAQRVYEMKLLNRPEKVYIPTNIITSPQDALKIVDGVRLGTGNSFEISTGHHILEVTKKGYRSQIIEIDVTKQNYLFEDINLEPIDPIMVNIYSNPDKANVIVDGITRELSNCGFWLEPGRYPIKLEKSGYFDIEDFIEIKEGETNKFEFDFVKNAGTIKFSINPPDAKLIIDGVNYSSHKLDLKPGKHNATITKENYITYSEDFEIVLGETLNKNIVLSKNSGILQLNLEPIDANISINNVKYDYSKEIELKPGHYKIVISKKGYHDISYPFEVKLGDIISKDFILKEKVGKFQFQVSPLDANVILKKNNKTYDNWTGLKFFKSIPIGTYQLKISRDDYASITEKIVITENKLLKKNITLIPYNQKMLSKSIFHKKQKWYSFGSATVIISFAIASNLIADNYYQNYQDDITTSSAISDREKYEKWDNIRDYSYNISLLPIAYGTYNFVLETFYKSRAKRSK